MKLQTIIIGSDEMKFVREAKKRVEEVFRISARAGSIPLVTQMKKNVCCAFLIN